MLAAAAMAGDEGQRSLLVLSDGADTSPTSVDDVTAAISDAGLLVDVVALEQSGPTRSRPSSSSPAPATDG